MNIKKEIKRLKAELNKGESFFSDDQLNEIFPDSQEMRDKTRRHIRGINSSKEFLKLFYANSDWPIQKSIQTFINRTAS